MASAGRFGRQRCAGVLRAAAMQQHHVGMAGMQPVERVPDTDIIVAVDAAGEGDARTSGRQQFGIGLAAGSEEVAAVDYCGGQGAAVDHRAGLRTRQRTGRRLKQAGDVVAAELEGVAPFNEANACADSRSSSTDLTSEPSC